MNLSIGTIAALAFVAYMVMTGRREQQPVIVQQQPQPPQAPPSSASSGESQKFGWANVLNTAITTAGQAYNTYRAGQK